MESFSTGAKWGLGLGVVLVLGALLWIIYATATPTTQVQQYIPGGTPPHSPLAAARTATAFIRQNQMTLNQLFEK